MGLWEHSILGSGGRELTHMSNMIEDVQHVCLAMTDAIWEASKLRVRVFCMSTLRLLTRQDRNMQSFA